MVDDFGDGTVTLAACQWPSVDQGGRLVFPSPESRGASSFDRGSLQAAINVHRQSRGQLAPDRPLRVGDVFQVRNYGFEHNLYLRLTGR